MELWPFSFNFLFLEEEITLVLDLKIFWTATSFFSFDSVRFRSVTDHQKSHRAGRGNNWDFLWRLDRMNFGPVIRFFSFDSVIFRSVTDLESHGLAGKIGFSPLAVRSTGPINKIDIFEWNLKGLVLSAFLFFQPTNIIIFYFTIS